MGSSRRRSRPGRAGGDDTTGTGGRETAEGPMELLDIDEQATLIADLRRKGEEQSRSTRRLFQALYILLLLALFYCTAMTLTMPFLLEHQAFFRSAVSPLGFILTYLVDVTCVLVAISIFAGRRDKILLSIGFGSGTLNLVGWLGVFAKYTPTPGLGFWWLPSTALFILAVALYVDTDLRRLTRDIDVLEALKYDYKKV